MSKLKKSYRKRRGVQPYNLINLQILMVLAVTGPVYRETLFPLEPDGVSWDAGRRGHVRVMSILLDLLDTVSICCIFPSCSDSLCISCSGSLQYKVLASKASTIELFNLNNILFSNHSSNIFSFVLSACMDLLHT